MILNVNISNSPYDIIIEKGSLNKVNHYIDIKQKVLILTDSGIPSTYVKTVQNQMEHSFLYTIEQGEHSKNFANFQKILTFFNIGYLHRFYADFCTFSLLIFIFFYCSSAVSFLYYNNPDLKSFLLPHTPYTGRHTTG